MTGTGIIDQFLETFTATSTMASGYWVATSDISLQPLPPLTSRSPLYSGVGGPDEDIIARLVKKTLFVGVFAYLIGNWNNLARIVFGSFAGLGLKASGTGLSSADFLRPGRIAQVGLDAGRPILDSISNLMGYISFFENFVQIVVLLFAWVVVLLAFFILAIQLFVTLIEFKLTTLAGFVLIPFGLFGKTAFAAERVLGNVISSGIKVGPGRHCRHRLDPVLAVHFWLRWRSADHRRGDDTGTCSALVVGPRYLRSGNRKRSGFRWTATRRGRCNWNGPCCWRRCCGRCRTCRGWCWPRRWRDRRCCACWGCRLERCIRSLSKRRTCRHR